MIIFRINEFYFYVSHEILPLKERERKKNLYEMEKTFEILKLVIRYGFTIIKLEE